MDMRTIDQNIKNNRYKSVDSFMTDVKLMFNNCRTFKMAYLHVCLKKVFIEAIDLSLQ